MDPSLAWQCLLLGAGIYLLLRGAQHLVDGAAAMALRAGVRPLIVGLTVVAFGTSAPELATSVSAALRAAAGEAGAADVAVGNVVGSNICNVGLILGVTALIRPLVVSSSLVRREIPFLIGISIFAVVLGRRGALDGIAGDLLLLTFLAFVGWMAWTALGDRNAAPSPSAGEDVDADRLAALAGWKAVLLVLLGCLLLTAGADLLVDSAMAIATAIGVSEAAIGLTVVALGTSLPELAASVVAARQGRADLALGNVVGSNVFNIGLVLGLPAAWVGLPVKPELVEFDMSVMIAFTVVLLPLCLFRRRIGRRDGALLVTGYVVYMVLVAIEAF
jgi:cation:H+ antiporter